MMNSKNYNSYQSGNSFKSSYNDRNFPFMDMNLGVLMPTNNNKMNHNMMNMNVNMNNSNTNQTLDIAKPREGYIQGNLFNNLYVPYKNYPPMQLIPNNEQARLLLEINEYTFAAHELRLYLDVFPEDNSLIDLFNQYRDMANQKTLEYESMYGPLSWSALSTFNNFSWENTPWPWESEVR